MEKNVNEIQPTHRHAIIMLETFKYQLANIQKLRLEVGITISLCFDMPFL